MRWPTPKPVQPNKPHHDLVPTATHATRWVVQGVERVETVEEAEELPPAEEAPLPAEEPGPAGEETAEEQAETRETVEHE